MAEDTKNSGEKKDMAYVEDIAASVAASVADTFGSSNQFTFGSKVLNFGSGSIAADFDNGQRMDAKNSSAADAVASTAKAGDNGMAESSAAMTKTQPAADAAAGLSLTPKTLLIGGAALAAATLGAIALARLTRKRK